MPACCNPGAAQRLLLLFGCLLTCACFCSYASTCQTLGMNIGYFTSFTAFLALNDADFCNNYLREAPQAEGILPLAGYLQFWGWFFAVATALIALCKHETNFQPAGNNQKAFPWSPLCTIECLCYLFASLLWSLSLLSMPSSLVSSTSGARTYELPERVH